MFLSAALLCSCSSKTESANDAALYCNSAFSLAKGYLYSADGTTMEYLSYQTLDTSVYCNQANCTHSDNSCAGRRYEGGFRGPIPYGDYIYYFGAQSEKNLDTDGDGREDTTQCSDTLMRYHVQDGSETVFAKIEGSQISTGNGAYVANNRLYFVGSTPYVEYPELPGLATPERQPKQGILYCVNLESGELKQFDSLYDQDLQYPDAWSTRGLKIVGAADGKLWLDFFYLTDGDENTDLADYTNVWFTLDLQTQALTMEQENAPFLEQITDGYLCYTRDGQSMVQKGSQTWTLPALPSLPFFTGVVSLADNKVWHLGGGDSWYYDLGQSKQNPLDLYEEETFAEQPVKVLSVYDKKLICSYPDAKGTTVFESHPLADIIS